jgi:uncharacterized membrane protein
MLLAVPINTYYTPATKFPTVGSLVNVILPNVYMIAGVLLFILLIFGGLGVIMGAGGSDPKKAEQGKQAVTMALIGFLIIFVSYWIVQIVGQVTGIDIFNPAI